MARPIIRIESDALGEVHVPDEAYFGSQSVRALANFPISRERLPFEFIKALALVKKAATKANMESGAIDAEIAKAIMAAADEVIAGAHQSDFVIDAFQAGAGVSQNMNMNEILANRAEERLGGERGKYSKVHPNDHVNHSQSSNDTIPTAIRIASLDMMDHLEAALLELRYALQQKAAEFGEVTKSGRTHLQDAVPMSLGDEVSSWASITGNLAAQLRGVRSFIEELNIGATAIGSGFGSTKEYREKVVQALRDITGDPNLRSADDAYAITASMESFVQLSGVLRNIAVELTKIANDLRLLDSGPTTGLGEVHLPARQQGSSIMPGKVNPVIPEMLNMVCFQVIGNDFAIVMAGQAGQMQLNVMTPLIARDLLESLRILSNGCRILTTHAIRGLKADEEKCMSYAENSLGLATALTPVIGYARAAKVAKEALESGVSIREIALRDRLMTEERLDAILSPSTPEEGVKRGKSKNGKKKRAA